MVRKAYTKDDIRTMIAEENVEFLRLQFSDVFGTIKNVEVPVSQLEKVLDNNLMVLQSKDLFVLKNQICTCTLIYQRS